MTVEVFSANRATTNVSSGGTDAPASGTPETWTVTSSAGFPSASSGATPPTQFHVADPIAPSEMIAVTDVSGTTWTVTRGAESTTPVTHVAGFAVQQVVTTGGFGQFLQVAGNTAWVGSGNLTLQNPGSGNMSVNVVAGASGGAYLDLITAVDYYLGVIGYDAEFNEMWVFGNNGADGFSVYTNNNGGTGSSVAQALYVDYNQNLNLSAGLVLSNGTVQTIASGGTILTAVPDNHGAIPVTAASAVTGLVLQAPTSVWTETVVLNQSGFPLTFAGSAASNVASGTSIPIAAYGAQTYVYDGGDSLWYSTGGPVGGGGGGGGGTAFYSLTSGTAFAAASAVSAGTAYYSLTSGTAFAATSALTAGTAFYSYTGGTAYYGLTSGTAFHAGTAFAATSAGTAFYSYTGGTAFYATSAGTAYHGGTAYFATTAGNFSAGATLPDYVAPAVVTLTASGTLVAVNAALGNAFNYSIGTSSSISNPTNSVDGQVIRFRCTSGGSFVTTWGTGYDFGSGSAPTLSTTSAKVDIVAFEYVGSITKWCNLGSGLGY